MSELLKAEEATAQPPFFAATSRSPPPAITLPAAVPSAHAPQQTLDAAGPPLLTAAAMPPDPSPSAAPQSPSAALPLAAEGGALLAGGTQLLAGLPATLTARPEQGQCLVLGAASPDGAPAALADFVLGQVCLVGKRL